MKIEYIKREKLKELFKILLLREEYINYNAFASANDIFWQTKWLDAKIDLLSCEDTVKDIKNIILEKEKS